MKFLRLNLDIILSCLGVLCFLLSLGMFVLPQYQQVAEFVTAPLGLILVVLSLFMLTINGRFTRRTHPYGMILYGTAEGCNPFILDNTAYVLTLFLKVLKEEGFTILPETSVHKFQPQGLTLVVPLAESHAWIHTWPEYRFASLGIFSCNLSLDLISAFDKLCEVLGANTNHYELKRMSCSHTEKAE